MRRVLDTIRQKLSATVWGRGAVSSEDARVARMLRRTLPEFYVACWAFGGLGVLGGVPALRQTFGEDYAVVLAAAIATAGLVSLVGLALPARMWRVEQWAVAMLTCLILLYAGAVALAGFTTGDLGRAGVGAAVYAMSALPRWRITDIARDRRIHGWT